MGNPRPNGAFGAGWYSSGGALIINALIGDLTIINLLIDGLKPEVLLQRYVFTRGALTQSRMNEMWLIPADITLAMRMQLTNKFLLLALQFSFAIPVLYALLAAHMWVAHWVDRWNFLHRLSPPPPTHGRLVVLMTEFFLPLSVLLHIVQAPLFFWHICENPEVVRADTGGGGGGGSGGGGGGGLSPSDLVNSSLASRSVASPPAELGSGVPGGGGGSGGGGGGGGSGGGGGVSASCSCADRLLEGLSSASLSCRVDAEQHARCEVEASGFSQTCGDGAIWQSSAMLILLVSTLCWGGVLLWYVYSGTAHQRARRSKERAQGRAAGLTVLPRRALNLFRFLMQRDVHHAPPRSGLPAGAHVLPLHRAAKPGYVHAARRQTVAIPRSHPGRASDSAVGGAAHGAAPVGDSLTRAFVGDAAPGTPHVAATSTAATHLPAPPPPPPADTASVQLHLQEDGRPQHGGQAPSDDSSPPSQRVAGDEAEAQQEPMTMEERVSKQAAHMERRLTAHMEALAAAHKAVAPPAPAPAVGRLPLRLPLRMSSAPMAPADERAARSQLGAAQLGASQLLLSSVEGEASFRESELVQLDEDTAFYLPPLVVTLLSSFCKDVGNRAVRHYIEHHRPLQKARAPRPNSGRCPHAAPTTPPPPTGRPAARPPETPRHA